MTPKQQLEKAIQDWKVLEAWVSVMDLEEFKSAALLLGDELEKSKFLQLARLKVSFSSFQQDGYVDRLIRDLEEELGLREKYNPIWDMIECRAQKFVALSKQSGKTKEQVRLLNAEPFSEAHLTISKDLLGVCVTEEHKVHYIKSLAQALDIWEHL